MTYLTLFYRQLIVIDLIDDGLYFEFEGPVFSFPAQSQTLISRFQLKYLVVGDVFNVSLLIIVDHIVQKTNVLQHLDIQLESVLKHFFMESSSLSET